jgi:hypothetical protein
VKKHVQEQRVWHSTWFTKNNLTLLDVTLPKHDDDEVSPHVIEMANDAHYTA